MEYYHRIEIKNLLNNKKYDDPQNLFYCEICKEHKMAQLDGARMEDGIKTRTARWPGEPGWHVIRARHIRQLMRCYKALSPFYLTALFPDSDNRLGQICFS